MDTRLALGYKGIDIPDPSAPLHKALTLNALLGQNEMQGMQRQQMQREMDKDATFRALSAQYKGDPEKLAQGLLEGGYVNEGLALRKSLNEERNSGLTQAKSASEMAANLAGSIMALPEEQRGMAYPQMAAEWKRLKLPNWENVPDQWSPNLIPGLSQIAARGLTGAQQQERVDYREAAGTPTGNALAAPPVSTVLPPAAANAEAGLLAAGPVRVAAQNTPLEAPPVEVNEKMPAETPDSLRAKGNAALRKGTAAGKQIAETYFQEANRLEGKINEGQKLDDAAKTREEMAANRKSTQAQKDREFENKLGDDFKSEPAVKNYRTVQPIISSMEEAATKDTAGSDLNMVYAISKIFDPDSVVREGEQIMVRNSGGLPSVLQSALGFVVGGQRLSPQLRQEILEEGRSRARALKQGHDSLATSYRQQAKEQGLNPDRVVRMLDIKMPSGAGPRKPGAGSGTQNDPFKIKGQDGFDAMPSGSFFTGPDGSLRRKP